MHHARRVELDALATSVEDAWRSHLNERAFSAVFKRLRTTLQLIAEDRGGNENIEERRGELTRDLNTLDYHTVEQQLFT